MKRIGIIWAVGLVSMAMAGCASTADGSVSGSASASAGTLCSHPISGSDGSSQCQYPDGLFAISYPEVNQYYWHPGPGYFTVTETYYKANAPGRAEGAWSGRSIAVGDGCVIDENWTPGVTTPPVNCMDSRTGNYRGATATEQQSILKFWRLMTRYVPSAER